MKINFEEYLTHRRTAKAYKEDKQIPKQVFNEILEAGRFAPTSMGLEPWRLLIHERGTSDIRKELLPLMWNQEAIRTCEYLILFVSKTKETIEKDINGWLNKTIASKPYWDTKEVREKIRGIALDINANFDGWLERQSYIALGTMMTVASLHNVDSTPMEGFIKKDLSDLLVSKGLIEKDETVSVAMALGYVDEKNKPYIQRHRRNKEEIIRFIK